MNENRNPCFGLKNPVVKSSKRRNGDGIWTRVGSKDTHFFEPAELKSLIFVGSPIQKSVRYNKLETY